MYKVLHLPLQLPVGNHSKQEVSWQWGVRKENTTWEKLSCFFNFVIFIFLINIKFFLNLRVVGYQIFSLTFHWKSASYYTNKKLLSFANDKRCLSMSNLGHHNGRIKPERWRETSVPSWSFLSLLPLGCLQNFISRLCFYAISNVVLHLSDSRWTDNTTELADDLFPSSSTAYVDPP